MLLRFHDVSFSHEQAASPLFVEVNIQFSPGWTGIVGANGTGKTTLLNLASGFLKPQKGRVQSSGKVVFCAQRTDDAPLLFRDFLAASDREACLLRGQMDIAEDWADRWSTLSHGERKRTQIAVALWQSPDVLLIDEPTNHIDAHARHMLFQALSSFRGIGLLVSHDRQLLDRLCRMCLFLTPPMVVMRPGNYSLADAQAERERESNLKKQKVAKQALKQIEREVRSRKHKASQADRKRSKRGVSAKDHDAKEKINSARVTGKDARAGQLQKQLSGRTRQVRQELEQLPTEKVYQSGIWLPNSRSRRDALFTLPRGSISLGSDQRLHYPELHMASDDRIGITGSNGAGKTSLIQHLMLNLNLPAGSVVYLPQEIEAQQSREILAQVRNLSREELGHVMTIVSRLGSRPHRLLETAEPSPGELRKVLLALGIIREPHLVILDEPTNHLDLPAIESLEKALGDCPCGLLLVSHDFTFLKNLDCDRWDLNEGRLTVCDSWEQQTPEPS